MMRLWNAWRVGASVLLIALMGGCLQAIPEFNLYVQAFSAQYEQGDAVLDIVGQAERVVFTRKDQLKTFDPNQSAYFLETIDPPITASFRASLKSLKSYNEALAGLASGEAAESLVTKMSAIITNTAAAGAALSVAASGPAGVVGANAAVDGLGVALTTLKPILATAATAASREEFRRQLVLAYPAMRDMLRALRDATPPMYKIMRRSLAERGSLDSDGDADLALSSAAEGTLRKDRQLLAGWVVLMDKALVALDQAAAAATASSGSTPVATLTDMSIELKVTAEQLKAIRLKQ